MEFWIDVGGTITAASPATDGRYCGQGSAPVTKGACGCGSDATRIVDGTLGRSDRFWAGYGLRLLDGEGRIVAETKLPSSIAQREFCNCRRRCGGASRAPAYELFSGEEARLLPSATCSGSRSISPFRP